MNKEKLLDFISKAIDDGAVINILIHGLDKTEIQAKKATREFGKIIGVEPHEEIGEAMVWQKVSSDQFVLDHFYAESEENFMKEDVTFGGDDNAA